MREIRTVNSTNEVVTGQFPLFDRPGRSKAESPGGLKSLLQESASSQDPPNQRLGGPRTEENLASRERYRPNLDRQIRRQL